VAIVRRDINDDGDLDFGPFLRNVANEILGDEDGDTFFDGEVANATVAVGRDCRAGSVVAAAPDTNSDDGGSSGTWIYVAAGVAVLGIVLAGAGTIFFRRRGESPTTMPPPAP
jgi:hypothetical protein